MVLETGYHPAMLKDAVTTPAGTTIDGIMALEEQYYFLWAPAVRWLRRPWMLAAVLGSALVCSPLVRHLNPVWLWGIPTHTLIKLDGIALGSLLALGLYTIALSRRAWFWIGLGAVSYTHLDVYKRQRLTL